MTLKADDTLRVVVTTCPEAAAEGLIAMAVGQRLAACCQQLPGVRSTYWWDGHLTSAPESVLSFKTTTTRVGALCDALTAEHPYEVPELLVLPVEAAGQAYAAWVAAEVAPH